MTKTIILDTSFIIACAQFKIDYFSEFERLFTFSYTVATLDVVMQELENLIHNGTFIQRSAAKLAYTIMHRKKIMILTTEKKVTADELILELADKETIVATIDAELKRNLKKKHIIVVFVRQKQYLMLQN